MQSRPCYAVHVTASFVDSVVKEGGRVSHVYDRIIYGFCRAGRVFILVLITPR